MKTKPIHLKQSGTALLALVLLLITGTSYSLLSRLNALAIKNTQDEHDARILAEAKRALIAYAVTFQEAGGGSPPNQGKHGYLPCPDTGVNAIQEGGAHGTCGSRHVNSLGRLPWRTLGLEPLKDSSGECLWYAVSGQYKHSGTSSPYMLNADTNGTFQIFNSDGILISGANQDERPVAVIIAPGPVVASQNRTNLATGTEICGGNYDQINYLDIQNLTSPNSGIQNHQLSSNPDQIDQLIVGSKGIEHLNDKIIYITKNDVWDAVLARNNIDSEFFDLVDDYSKLDIDNLTKWIAGCIAKYGNTTTNRSLLYPARLNLSNDINIRDYRNSALYTEIDPDDYTDPPLFGRLPDTINYSNSKKGTTGRLISDCDLTTGAPHGLTISSSDQIKYLTMWENWKDHFFYVVSDLYKPRDTSEWDSGMCLPMETCFCGGGVRCVQIVGATDMDYSALLIFSNGKLNSATRYAPPVDVNTEDNDTKKQTSQYLEIPNSLVLDNYVDDQIQDNTIEIYNYDPSQTFNDVIYCLNDDDGNLLHHEIRRCPVSN